MAQEFGPAQPRRRRAAQPSERRRHASPRPTASARPTERYVEAGWGGVPFPAEYGGGGFPWLVGIAMQEMLTAANMAFSMCPLLTQGAIDMLLHHGSEEQQEVYLPKMVTGEWTGTMNLTEPQAGSDVGALTHQGRPRRRRHLPHHRHEDLHHLRRARPGREHRPPRAGPRARRAARHQGHLVLHRPQVPRERRRHARRAQRRQVRVDRAQDGHQGQPHLRHGLRRRRRLPHRRGEPGHAVHVHDDEQRPPVGGRAGPVARRAGLPGRRRLRPRAAPGPGAGRAGRASRRRSSSTPTCAACCSP